MGSRRLEATHHRLEPIYFLTAVRPVVGTPVPVLSHGTTPVVASSPSVPAMRAQPGVVALYARSLGLTRPVVGGPADRLLH